MSEHATGAESIPAWAARIRRLSRSRVGAGIDLIHGVYRVAAWSALVALAAVTTWTWTTAGGGRAMALSGAIVLAGFFVTPVACFAWINPPFSMPHRRAGWTRLCDVAPVVPRAIVASEDPYFLWHFGFDPVAMLAAHRWNRAQGAGARRRGGSTLTQQLAKNLFLPFAQSYRRKIAEAIFAALMEALWSKRRILEVYLNVVEFGDDVHGIEPAAHRFFGCAPSMVTAEQAALLATALPRPRTRRVDAPSRSMRENAAAILRRMEWCGRELVASLY
jgi:monofunctional biosynthetic peptidoglycan transglycosylase